MRRLVVIIVVAILVLLQILVLQSEYWIILTKRYAIYPMPLARNTNILGFGESAKERAVIGVTRYCVLGRDTVAGITDEGQYFLGLEDGVVLRFDGENKWKEECKRLSGNFPDRLSLVTRFSDPNILAVQIVLVCVAIGMLMILAWGFRMKLGIVGINRI